MPAFTASVLSLTLNLCLLSTSGKAPWEAGHSSLYLSASNRRRLPHLPRRVRACTGPSSGERVGGSRGAVFLSTGG